jgi:TATA-box binding protein (TBP) (component of TFIID and TFIIIB)
MKWDNINFIDYVNVKENEINNLPNGVNISTMCASCNLNTKINIVNIEKYLQLNADDIITKKQNNDKIKTLTSLKNNSKKIHKIESKKTNNNYFYNQITIIIRITHGYTENINEEPRINMKLFKNGAIQMSGCKSLHNINIALNKLIYKLKEIKAKVDDGKIVEIPFVETPSEINIIKFKIDMINSNYKVNIQIDRDKLYGLLLKKRIKSTFEPCIRACIIVKYAPLIEQKDVSIFIFQKGNIIITGAKSRLSIISSYEYINDILITHIDDIIKKDDKIEENLIMDIYNNILKDIEVGILKL